jgi:hypothetical protein
LSCTSSSTLLQPSFCSLQPQPATSTLLALPVSPSIAAGAIQIYDTVYITFQVVPYLQRTCLGLLGFFFFWKPILIFLYFILRGRIFYKYFSKASIKLFF